MIYPRYSLMFPTLQAVRDSLDASYDKLQAQIEVQALALEGDARVRFLTNYSCQKGDEMIARWQQLAFHLIVKFNDSVVKPTDENGAFKRNKYGLGERVQRPGYPERYARKIISDRLAIPQ